MKLDDQMKRERMLDKLFLKWVVRDAPGAAAFALKVEDEDIRKGAILRVMDTWSVQDAQGALSWARDAQFADHYEREVAMSMACTKVSRSDPQEAIRLAIEYKLDDGANGLMGGLTAQWAQNDVASAREWAIGQPPGEQRNSLIESIALVMFDNNPANAAQLILDQIPAGESRDKAVLSILSSLAIRNPEAAQAWAEAFPEGPLRASALEELDRIQNRLMDDL